MPVLISMSVAVLIWSLYPLAAVMGLKTMTGLELIVVSSFFSAIGIVILAIGYFLINNNVKNIINYHKTLSKKDYLTIFSSGITNILCHGLFFSALSMSHKGGVSLLYESWPIIAVIATPFLIQKQWKEVSFKEFLVSLFALVGMAAIILSNEEVNLPFIKTNTIGERSYIALLGYILAFIGAYACAMCVVFKGVIADRFEQVTDTFGSTILSEFYCRIITLIIILIALPLIQNNINIENINWEASAFIGFVVMIAGGMLYTYALIKTDKPTIHILYYLVPLFAVIFLWLYGETTISTGLFIGGIIIIACNIYLYFAAKKAPVSQDL